MRAIVVFIVSILLATPLAASLQPRAPIAPASLAFDPSDAQLMLLLARLEHPGLEPLSPPIPTGTESLPDLLMRIGERAHAPMSAEDAAQFAALDPRVSAPLITLFLGIEEAWDAYDDATAEISQDEIMELYALRQQGLEGSPRGLQLVAQIDQESLLAAAIMITSLVEDTVAPQLQLAAEAGVWPAAGAWDSVGVLRLGSPGNDLESLDRIVQFDPRGDDTYHNNAGGVTILDPLVNPPWNIITPIAVSIDLGGNDRYENWYQNFRLGSTLGASPIGLGFGLALDFSGNDDYSCAGGCMGSGLGLLRDYAGDDRYVAGSSAMGDGFPLGIARDEHGHDYYGLSFTTGGYANLVGETGLLWDRGGTDHYASPNYADNRLGWGNQGGRGWFVDEGPEADVYETATSGAPINRHGCNDCTWEMGTSFNGIQTAGEGNDNKGGLSHLLFRQDPIIRQLSR